MTDSSYIRFQKIAVAAGVVILTLKFIAFYVTNSNAIFSDAMESIVNVVAGSFALYSLILAAKPKDKDHPYGHGKIEFISAGIEGTLILIAGIGIVYKAVEGLIIEHELTQLNLGIYIAGAAGLINFILGKVTERYGVKYNSVAMITSGKHLMSDGYTSAGMIVGLGFVKLTGWIWIDSAIALIFGVFIGFVGLKEIRKSLAGIMDEADFHLVSELISKIDQNRTENWIDLHNFRAQKFGKNVHIDCHVTVPYYLTVAEAHQEVDALETLVDEQHQDGIEMFIHTDPCTASSCRICSKPDCKVRAQLFEEKLDWNLETVLKNRQHK